MPGHPGLILSDDLLVWTFAPRLYHLIYLTISVSSLIILYIVSDKYLLLFHCWWLTLTRKSAGVFNTPFLLLQGGFSNGYFIYNSDSFDINKQGVVSLRTDVTLDRETEDRYILEVQTLCCTTWLRFLSPGFSLFQWKIRSWRVRLYKTHILHL